MAPKNIQIPYNDFKRLLWVLESIDTQDYDEAFKMEFEAVLDILRGKENALAKRQAYSSLIAANKSGDEDKKIDARIEYLQRKNNPF